MPLRKALEELTPGINEVLPGGNSMTQPTNKGIANSWGLIAFAKQFGPKMQIGEFSNKETGEVFKSCIFTQGDTKTFVTFSSKMGELTPKEIVNQKDSLQIVQLESGNYSLCHIGANAWEDVDLGL